MRSLRHNLHLHRHYYSNQQQHAESDLSVEGASGDEEGAGSLWEALELVVAMRVGA
jgi:hypothetical protein